MICLQRARRAFRDDALHRRSVWSFWGERESHLQARRRSVNDPNVSRRDAPLLPLISAIAAASWQLAVSISASAAEGGEGEKRLWISGKSTEPKKDPKAREGTKRDPKFLKCLSQCLSECKKPGSYGYSKSEDECLEDCRDECCFTYEQCSYAIR
ncbi:unnamed protein product [Vitrella brassicaformis CCMP3155]|uniref:Uncharacterized protein n=2 Tax=Vitrella brassicaformis TaxID=1169539 RepID=A0A0G4ECE9_VITBC|nr:unnamed protein product [Vitrella brassicaformis CCMP3155]|eukprot:CEL93616.1 unnamed protein product [Vitrella brassicaformis CCMP3155]